MSAIRLGVLSTHPVQYQAPLYRALAARGDVDLTVFYAHRPTPEQQGDEFGVAFEWDTDLLGGYRSVFLENRGAARGTGFTGYDTPSIREEVTRGCFDAFVVGGWHARTYLQGIVACWRNGTPIMVRGDSYLLPDEPRVKRAMKRAVYPYFLRHFDACLCVGTRSEAYFTYYGARRIFRVPHFVDNEFFASTGRSDRSRAQLRALWKIPQGAFVCSFVGKLIPRKRPLDLIRAAARVGVHLLFAGDGVLRAACEAEAARLGVGATFLGFVNQSGLPDVHACADVFSLPSEVETWGLVVNEAMASGLPVIVADTVACAPDLVIAGETGFVHRVSDVASLAACLNRTRERLAAGQQLGDAARGRVCIFTAENSASALVRAAHGVLPPRRDGQAPVHTISGAK